MSPTFMRFTNFIDIVSYTSTTNGAGQSIQTEDCTTKVKCVFLYDDDLIKVTPVIKFEEYIEFIIDDSFRPTYSHKIKNLRTRYGDVIEIGPLEIVGIKKYVGYDGRRHHYRIRARKMKNC